MSFGKYECKVNVATRSNVVMMNAPFEIRGGTGSHKRFQPTKFESLNMILEMIFLT